MRKLDEDVFNSIDLIEGKKRFTNKGYAFGSISKIYPFTTERIAGYIKFFDLTDKTLLVIAASGDHFLNSVLQGSTDVDIFDINRLTKYYTELKIAGAKTLEYEEFINFFVQYIDKEENLDIFNERTFNKVISNLSKESFYYWSSLLKRYSGNYLATKSKLFDRDIVDFETVRKCNLYLEYENFYLLKEKLKFAKNPNFYAGNVTKISKQLKRKYDCILLSNISDYAPILYKENPLENFKSLITEDLNSNLSKNGVIQLAYIYGTNNDTSNTFYNKEKRDSLFPEELYPRIYFKSVFEDEENSNSQIDSIILSKRI